MAALSFCHITKNCRLMDCAQETTFLVTIKMVTLWCRQNCHADSMLGASVMPNIWRSGICPTCQKTSAILSGKKNEKTFKIADGTSHETLLSAFKCETWLNSCFATWDQRQPNVKAEKSGWSRSFCELAAQTDTCWIKRSANGAACVKSSKKKKGETVHHKWHNQHMKAGHPIDRLFPSYVTLLSQSEIRIKLIPASQMRHLTTVTNSSPWNIFWDHPKPLCLCFFGDSTEMKLVQLLIGFLSFVKITWQVICFLGVFCSMTVPCAAWPWHLWWRKLSFHWGDTTAQWANDQCIMGHCQASPHWSDFIIKMIECHFSNHCRQVNEKSQLKSFQDSQSTKLQFNGLTKLHHNGPQSMLSRTKVTLGSTKKMLTKGRWKKRRHFQWKMRVIPFWNGASKLWHGHWTKILITILSSFIMSHEPSFGALLKLASRAFNWGSAWWHRLLDWLENHNSDALRRFCSSTCAIFSNAFETMNVCDVTDVIDILPLELFEKHEKSNCYAAGEPSVLILIAMKYTGSPRIPIDNFSLWTYCRAGAGKVICHLQTCGCRLLFCVVCTSNHINWWDQDEKASF